MKAANVKTNEVRNSVDARRLLATSSEGLPLLGFGVFWNFREELKMPLSQFRQMLLDVGMPEKIAPPTRKKSAVGKAVDQFLAETGERKRRFRRKLVDDKNTMVQVIVTESVDSVGADAAYQTETKIVFDKETEKVAVIGTPEEKEQIHRLMEEQLDLYTSDQIRSAVLRFLFSYAGGVTVRDNGGLYFIPAHHKDEFEMMQKLFEKLQTVSSGTNLGLIQIPDSAETAQTMWRALVVEAEREIAENMREIEEMKKDPLPKATDRRYKNLSALRNKIEMYSVLLRGTADDLVKKVEGVEQAFVQRVADIAKAEAKKK